MIKNNVLIALIFTCFLVCNCSVFGQGPHAPEAGGFEPVDVPDMVNLFTGDLTYTLPLLKVPSPEGGYPVSLAYHAGVGIDQEASWVGLGWNINPGSIMRGVNGFPDDWASTKIINRFYDAGGSETETTISTGWTSPTGLSIARSISYNSNKGWGGSVSLGYGLQLSGGGTLGGSATLGVRPGGQVYGGVGAGLTMANGLGVGANISSNGLGVNAGYNNKMGAGGNIGFSHSWSGQNAVSIGVEGNKLTSMGITLSSSGVSLRGGVGRAGVSMNVNSTSTVSQSDYNVDTDNASFNIAVMTPWGVFSAGYSKQHVKWALNSKKENFVSGGLYYNKARTYRCTIEYDTYVDRGYGDFQKYTEFESKYVESTNDCTCQAFELPPDAENCREYIDVDPGISSTFFMDVYEIGGEGKIKYNSQNNGFFPAYDNFNVSAQGLSGTMTPYLFQTGSLNGIGGHEFRDLEGEYNLTYTFPDSNTWQYDRTEFDRNVNFEFNNVISSSLIIDPVTFVNNSSAVNPFDYLAYSTTPVAPRKRSGHYVEYYTNEDLEKNRVTGLMLPQELNLPQNSSESIGAYKITTPDGKTYHYSLAVYNHETLTRVLGTIDKPERESYFETQQLQPYATHWLLIAVTGPDFIDVNNNNRVDEMDYGYWVDFQYGRWSDAFVWKTPYGKESEYDPLSETTSITRGRKQLYYLDRIKTRTHTAIFVKDIRNDNSCEEWVHQSVEYGFYPDKTTFDTPQFTIPSQKSLKLDKIILVKNENDDVNKAFGANLATESSVDIRYREEKEEIAYYNSEDNIIDVWDNLENSINKSIRVIDFSTHQTYDLVNGSPNSTSGRLTLNGLSIKGKGGKMTVPPYKFTYSNSRSFDINKKDEWGYYSGYSSVWSLNKIINPIGNELIITYEPDSYSRVAVENGKPFSQGLKFTFLTEPPRGSDWKTAPKGITRIKIEVDDNDPEVTGLKLNDYFDENQPFFIDMWYSAVYNHSGAGYDRSAVNIDSEMATIVELNSTYNYMIVDVLASSPSFRDAFQHSAEPVSVKSASNSYSVASNQKLPRYNLAWDPDQDDRKYSMKHLVIGNKVQYITSGVRVKGITVKDNANNSFSTYYDYNIPNTTSSSGVISYFPHKENSNVAIPYASELPPPITTYEYVTVYATPKGNLNSSDYLNKTLYQFEVLPSKDANKVRFGDLFEISSSTQLDDQYNGNQDKVVNAQSLLIEDHLSQIGQLISIKNFNGENQLLSETKNEFLNKESIEQGIIQESFQTYKIVNYKDISEDDKWLLNSSSRITYPTLVKQTSVFSGGLKNITSPISYDTNTGQILETLTTNSLGEILVNKTVPAYSVYPEMGSKVDNPSFMNMLVQPAITTSKIQLGENWKILNSTITTWNNEWSYLNYNGTYSSYTNPEFKKWRKHQNFLWNGNTDSNGAYLNYIGDFDSFNWAVGSSQTNPNWIKISEINYYDHFSNPIERSDINGNRSSTKMDASQSKIISVSNTSLKGHFSSSAEDLISGTNYFGGQVYKGSTATITSQSHTGKNALKVGANVKAFSVKPQAGNYKISVWAYKGTGYNYSNTKVKVSGIVHTPNSEETIHAGDWVQYNFVLKGVTSGQEVYVYNSSANAIYDDFRLYPVESNLVSYVYNDWDEIEYILGNNNLAAKYEYDSEGRLVKVYNEAIDVPENVGGFKPSKEMVYNYKGTAELDTNKNGEIDKAELYDPLKLFTSVNDPSSQAITITANASGGSGNYSYRWAYGDSAELLTYGSWTSINRLFASNPCPDGVIYYKCQVRDNETLKTLERESAVFRTCDGEGEPLKPILE